MSARSVIGALRYLPPRGVLTSTAPCSERASRLRLVRAMYRGASDAPWLPHRRTGRGRMCGRLGGGAASDPRDFHGAVAAVTAGQLHCCDVATLRHSLERPRVDVELCGCFPRGKQHLRFGVINPFCHATIMHDDLDFASHFGPACRNLSDLPLFWSHDDNHRTSKPRATKP